MVRACVYEVTHTGNSVLSGTIGLMEDPVMHHRFRKPLGPFFSRQGIQRIESAIARNVQMLDDRLKASSGSESVVSLEVLFSAMTGDVICGICLGENLGILRSHDSAVDW
jgi:cytochrome P450